jgi:hypothetical protein
MATKRVPSAQNLPAWKKKARSYDTAQGRRLNKYPIAVKHRLPPQTFEYRQAHGWASLGGRSLDSVDMPYQPGKGFMEGTYLETEVDDAMRKPEQTQTQALVDGEPWPMVPAMLKRLEVGHTRLSEWDKECPYLSGVPFDTHPHEGLHPKPDAVSPNILQKCKAYRPGLAEAVNAVREQTKQGTFVNRRPVELSDGRQPVPPDTVWVDPKSTLFLMRDAWKGKDAWKRVLRLIRAGKIRAKVFGFLEPGVQARWCVRKDVEEARELLLKRKRKGRLLPAAATFNGIFLGTPQRWGVKVALRALNRELETRGARRRVSLVTFRSWIRKSRRPSNQRGLPADIARAFVRAARRIPDATKDEAITTFPSSKRPVPDGTGRADSVLKADILALAEAIAAVEQASADATHLKGAEQLCDDYGVRDVRDRAAVQAYLASLPLRRVRARAEGCTRETDLYDPAEVECSLAGRNIVEMALDAWPRLQVNSEYGRTVLAALGDGWATFREVLGRLGKADARKSEYRNLYLKVKAILEAALDLGMAERNPPASAPVARGSWNHGKAVVRWRKVSRREQPPTAGNTPEGGNAAVPGATADGSRPREKGRRGRRPGQTKKVQERNDRVIQDFSQHKYPNIAELARAYNLQRSYVSALINDAKRRGVI